MSELASLALAHLRLSVLALTLGAVLAIPLALFALDRPRARTAILGVASVVQTVPGLALLAVMVPLLGWLANVSGLGIPSIGELPAVLALSVYAVLPIVRGTVLGIRGIDPATIEAAEALGMTRRQRLRIVELPLALPHVVGGLRTATVWTVGMATLATPVGARSLGELIFSGLATRHADAILAGCAAAATLAIVLDRLLALAEVAARTARPWRHPAIVALALLLSWAPLHTAALSSGVGASAAPIRIGAKGFTEQRVLAALLARRVASTGASAEILPSLGTSVAFGALTTGELDLYVEYTGTVWTTLMHREDAPDRAMLRREVEAWLDDEHDIRIVAALGFENAYALVVPERSSVRRISELGDAHALVLATDYEFLARGEWRALQARYGLVFADRRPMDPALLFDAIAGGDVDVATGFTTDPRIAASSLRVLEDDRGAIPPYDAVILARRAFLDAHPELTRALQALEGSIDAERMRAASLRVDRDHATPEDAASALER